MKRLCFVTLVLLSRNAVVFLVAWEVMTGASYLLVSFDHQVAEAKRAGSGSNAPGATASLRAVSR